MNKKLFKLITGLICLVMLVTPISTPLAQEKGDLDELSNEEEELLENELQEFQGSLLILELIEELPENIAENGIEEGVAWLNTNKGEELQGIKFINDNGNLNVIEDNDSLISTFGVMDCAWGIGKAIAANALPWSKILKIKKAVKIMGGTKVVAKTMVTAYKHQRNLGYGKAKAIKRAINVTKKALPAEYAKHWVEFFSLGVVKKHCF